MGAFCYLGGTAKFCSGPGGFDPQFDTGGSIPYPRNGSQARKGGTCEVAPEGGDAGWPIKDGTYGNETGDIQA